MRTDSGVRGVDAARQVGIAQTTLSRYERGEQVPTVLTVRDLCRVYGATAEQRRNLERLLAAREGPRSIDAADVRKAGGWQMQDDVGAAEEAATEVTEWWTTVVSGLCQTRDYATALFGPNYLSPENVTRTVDARMARQRILEQPGRRFRIVHTEGALSWCIGSPAVMIGQLDRLIEAAKLPAVELGVVPFGTAATTTSRHNLTIFDKRAVLVGTLHRTDWLRSRNQLARYLEFWEEVRPLVRWGDEAVAVFERVRARYASL